MWTEMKGVIGAKEQGWSQVKKSKSIAKGSLEDT